MRSAAACQADSCSLGTVLAVMLAVMVCWWRWVRRAARLGPAAEKLVASLQPAVRARLGEPLPRLLLHPRLLQQRHVRQRLRQPVHLRAQACAISDC